MAKRRQAGEGSVYRRSSDGRWIATVHIGWRDGQRQRRVFTGATPDAAMAKRTRWLDQRRAGFTLPKGRVATVSEWCQHWLVNVAQPRVEPTTFHGSYESKVRDHIIGFFSQTPLNELCEEDVEAWHQHLGKRLSAASITQCHRILSSAIKAAVIRGRIPRNPVSNVPPPRIARPEMSPPSAEEIDSILTACETWPRGCRWIVGIATGARQGEILALRWSDVHLTEPASITISRTAARVKGELIYKLPKSVKSRRTVQIGAATVAALKQLRKSEVAAIDGLVFTDRKGRPVHPRADWQDWQDLLASVDLGHYTVHSLRHGAATSLLEAGLPARAVQEVMGHASPAFTMSAYAHVRPVLHQAAADAMDEIIKRR